MAQHPDLAPAAMPTGFAVRLAVFYAAIFGLVGTHLPFFPVWLQAIGIDASWIGVIVAVPSVTRFTVLPFITSTAERLGAIRGAMRCAAVATTVGFCLIGTLTNPLAVLIAYAVMASLWTPIVPLTDGYALKAVERYGLNYGPLRLWGSAAFVVGALGCGWLLQEIAARHLIWAIAGMAGVGALTSAWLSPVPASGPRAVVDFRATRLLRDPGFLAIIVASALIQGSHAAYYTFASIAWQREGIDGLSIAMLWALGVLAEIVVFALASRIKLAPSTQVVLAAACGVVRWVITAGSPPLAVLAAVQTLHGLTFGLTMVATMRLLVQHVPSQVMASAQGYLAAATGLVMGGTSIVSGALFAWLGQGIYGVMAGMALTGGVVIWLGRHRAGQPMGYPQSDASGGNTVLPL
jgi:PPP family 3-phenylpropionic acid transporter